MREIKTKKCLYCTQEKNIEEEFSLEHIFPVALGGSIFSDLFKTRDVCKRCNNITGLFIDGMFIKNFFTQNDKAESYLNYLDFDKPAALPLQYMGILNNCPIDTDEVCEHWLGPHGGIIYHIRKNADSRYDSMIGGNPINNKRDGGTAYIFAHRDNYWNLVLLKSCQNYFENARKIYCTKISYPENLQDNSLPSFDIPSDKDIKAVDFFKSIMRKRTPGSFWI
jgi:hypothetical protein